MTPAAPPDISLESLRTTLHDLLQDGPRPVGTPEHDRQAPRLAQRLQASGGDPIHQAFAIRKADRIVRCANVGVFLSGAEDAPPAMLCTPLDTPRPAPGEALLAGASLPNAAVALLLTLAPLLARARLPQGVLLSLLDAEMCDVEGQPPGHAGALAFVEHSPLRPAPAVVLGALGGAGRRMDVDVRCLLNAHARRHQDELFALGEALHPEYFAEPTQLAIPGAHEALLDAGIPTLFLGSGSDPVAGTAADTERHCSLPALQAVGRVLLRYVLGERTA